MIERGLNRCEEMMSRTFSLYPLHCIHVHFLVQYGMGSSQSSGKRVVCDIEPCCDEFASFGYQAQSWRKPGRGVAKSSAIWATRTRASASSSPTWDVGPNESSPSATSVPLTGAMSRVRWLRSRSRDRCSPTSRYRSPAAGTIRPEWARGSTNASRDERGGKPRGQGIVGSVLRCRQSPASSQQQARFAVAEAA
jgi:hypothetical protein